jgi:hypothetical protein
MKKGPFTGPFDIYSDLVSSLHRKAPFIPKIKVKKVKAGI